MSIRSVLAWAKELNSNKLGKDLRSEKSCKQAVASVQLVPLIYQRPDYLQPLLLPRSSESRSCKSWRDPCLHQCLWLHRPGSLYILPSHLLPPTLSLSPPLLIFHVHPCELTSSDYDRIARSPAWTRGSICLQRLVVKLLLLLRNLQELRTREMYFFPQKNL